MRKKRKETDRSTIGETNPHPPPPPEKKILNEKKGKNIPHMLQEQLAFALCYSCSTIESQTGNHISYMLVLQIVAKKKE